MWKRLDFESFQLSPLSNQIPPKMHKHEQKGKWASLPWGRWIHSVFFKYSIPLHRGIKHFKIVYYHFKFRTRKKMYLGLVSALPTRIKGHGFPQYCPSHSHMYIV